MQDSGGALALALEDARLLRPPRVRNEVFSVLPLSRKARIK